MSDTSVGFRAIHDTFRPKILRYLARMVGQDEAEDLAQTVMVKVSEGLRDFRGDSELSTWIYRIATNAALDRLRSPAFHHAGQNVGSPETTMDGDVDSEQVKIPLEQQTPSVEATAMREEMNACIREFIERLPENYKTAMVLSELEEFRNSEIAEILGVSLDTIKIRLHRARERLRKELKAGCTFYRDERNEFACHRKPLAPTTDGLT